MNNTCTNSPWCESGERCRCEAYQYSNDRENKRIMISRVFYIILAIGLIFLGLRHVSNTFENDIWMLENCTGNSQETFTCGDTGEYDL